jgi:hypothetical protein
VTGHVSPSWRQFFEEFHCQGCGAQEAYRSRPRGFFESYMLPLLLLRAVRCERCYHRSYVLRTIPALERFETERKQSQGTTSKSSKPNGRVA